MPPSDWRPRKKRTLAASGGGVEVAGQDHVTKAASLSYLLYGPRRDHRLQLTLVLEGELPVWQMVDEQKGPYRLRSEDLSD